MSLCFQNNAKFIIMTTTKNKDIAQWIEFARSEIFQLILDDFLTAGIDMNGPHIYAKAEHVQQYNPNMPGKTQEN